MSSLLQLFWFSVSGVLALFVDITVLYLLEPLFGLYIARVFSFLCAVLTTWLFNRAITFRKYKSGYSLKKEFGVYLGLMIIGGMFNYGVYVLLINEYTFIATYPALGVAAGSLAGMLVNLCTARLILFRL